MAIPIKLSTYLSVYEWILSIFQQDLKLRKVFKNIKWTAIVLRLIKLVANIVTVMTINFNGV